MTSLRFAKGHGTGNDFVLIADPEGAHTLTGEVVAELCDRRFGVGGDGLIRAVRSEHLSEGAAVIADAPDAEWFMDYWNADGTTAEMCGNGVRVFLHFLVTEGLVDLSPGQMLRIGTRAGVREVTATVEGYAVNLGGWRPSAERLVTPMGETVPRPALGIDVGNPHLVAALADQDELDRLNLAEAPEVNPAPPNGANIEFVVPADPFVANGTARIHMRVHERGVGETLSCGTGAAAAALAFRHWGGEELPDRWIVEVPGGSLGVRMEPGTDPVSGSAVETVVLSGPATIVYRGELAL